MGDTHWLRMPNTLKPSFGCPMPIADGCCSLLHYQLLLEHRPHATRGACMMLWE